MTERTERLQRTLMGQLRVLLARRDALEEAIEGGKSPDHRTVDQMVEGWATIGPLGNQIESIQRTIFEYSGMLREIITARILLQEKRKEPQPVAPQMQYLGIGNATYKTKLVDPIGTEDKSTAPQRQQSQDESRTG